MIEVRGLTKTYRTYKKRPGLAGAVRGLFHREYEQAVAADNVSFQRARRRIGRLSRPEWRGQNHDPEDACGLALPTSGSARVLGYVPWERKDGYRRQFALLLGQKNQLWWDLPARESLELNAKSTAFDAEAFRAHGR